MKPILFTVLLVCSALAGMTQQDSLQPPFRRFPTVPPFKLLQTDSTTYFSKSDLKKNQAVLLILFSPECSHCRHETEAITRRINDFRKVQIVMATMMPFETMRDFYSEFGLARFPNIHVGKDVENLLPSFYAIRNLPFIATYDRKGNLIDVTEGSVSVENLLSKFQ